MKQYLVILDRAAAQVNALLVVIAVGLGMLDMTVLVGKSLMTAIAESMPTEQAQSAGFDASFGSPKSRDPATTRP